MRIFIIIKKGLSYILRHNYFSRYIPDKIYLEILYWCCIGERLNFNKMKGFNAKIQWLKLYNRNPRHTQMVDKANVKKLVTKEIGSEYVIPTLGIWNKFEDIDFSALPNSFVMKTTHGGGGLDVIVVKNKNNINFSLVKKKLEKSLQKSIWWQYREWPYRNVPRKIIIEEYLEDENGELRDYKFFCFNGEPKFLFMATGRMSNLETTFDFLDLDFNRLPVTNGHPNITGIPQKPVNFEKMIEIAKRLSKDEKFVRVDLYNVKGKIYFGEYTFYHNSGLVPIEPKKWDFEFGKYITI